MISTTDLFQLRVQAADGDMGSVLDVIFHDADWRVRDIVVDTGAWVFGRRIRLDPGDVLEPDLAAGILPLHLSKEQVKNSPPASRDDGRVAGEILTWTESNTAASMPQTLLLGGAALPAQPLETQTPAPNLHLRSVRDLLGYAVIAGEDEAGTLESFLVDPIAWDLPVALVRLDAPEQRTVLLPTRLVADVGWPERVLRTYLNASVLRNAPAYDARVLDERLYLPAVTDYYATRV